MSRIAVNGAQPEVTPPRYDKARARNRRAAVLKALDGGAMLIPEICSATKDNDGYVRKVLNEFLAAGLVTKARWRGGKSNTLSFKLTAKGHKQTGEVCAPSIADKRKPAGRRAIEG
jgi:hypothetical protein